MKLYAPKYYKDFVCIADKCKHSCCIGWEIDIDPDTAEKYAELNCGYGAKIKESVEITDGTPRFKLAAHDRCPHLCESGLCRIILELGEDHLCEICREHPRFYNDTPRGKEVGLGLSCEEACRIILGSDDYANFIEIGDAFGEARESEIDTVAARDGLYAILSESSLLYPEKLQKIYSEYDVSPLCHTDDEWREILESLEYLDDTHRALFSKYSSVSKIPNALEKPLTRALAYFILRHTAEAFDENEFRASLGFCLFSERLLASVAAAEGIDSADSFCEIARIVSEELEYSEDNTEALKFEFFF